MSNLDKHDDQYSLIKEFDSVICAEGGIGFVAAAWQSDSPARILLYASQMEPFSQLDAESAWWEDDPIIELLQKGAMRPFRHEDAWANPSPSAAQRWPALVASGLDRGIVFPTSRPPYVGSLLIFGNQDPDLYARLGGDQPSLHLLATYFHARIVDMAHEGQDEALIRNTLIEKKRSAVNLTNREIDCLRWLSLGKTAQDIADIEDISVFTVRSYLRTAMEKLDASTQAQVICTAMKLGFLRN